MRVSVENASIVEDLKKVSHGWRAAVGLLVAAFLAYYSCFGVAALFGKWRPSLFDPAQIAIFLVAGIVQNLIGRRFDPKLIRSGVVFGVAWFLPALGVTLVMGSRNDFPDNVYFLLIPIGFSLLNALFYRSARTKLSLDA